MTTATATTPLRVGTWAIDPAHSSIDFSVRHLMVSKVRGRFETFSGTITVAPDGTLNTGSEQRDGHVKSADFFDVDHFPVAVFASTAVRPNGEAYLLDGNLTIKGISRPVSLDLEFNGVSPGQGYGEVSGYEASVVLSRRDFGIDIDLPMETGGAVVGDKVTITLNIEAVKQP
jgi:polyisoprenoid-binding protein YceI